MDDLNDPRISAYRPQRRLRVPAPPGPRRGPSKAEREQEARAKDRAERLHLVGLTTAGMLIMALILAIVVILFVLVLVGHH